MVQYRAGDRVRVKSAAEIARTLDKGGRFEALPFMPEMAEHCGRVYTVSRSAHKTCDTVDKTGGRRLRDCVHLADLRCDGAAHGDCEALCLFFWKSAWLEPADANAQDNLDAAAGTISESLVVAEEVDGHTCYRCQATLLPEFTEMLPWWEVSQYVADVRSRNVGFGQLLGTGLLQVLRNLMKGPGYNFWRKLHNALQGPLGGVPIEHQQGGAIPAGKPTPVDSLDLQVGDLVEVKSYDEIHATLDRQGKNRGMRYDIEMRPYSGRHFRVSRRVHRIIEETSGRMLDMKTPSIILDGVFCQSKFSSGRLFCPRRLPSFWREIWLKRVPEIPVKLVTEESKPGEAPGMNE